MDFRHLQVTFTRMHDQSPPENTNSPALPTEELISEYLATKVTVLLNGEWICAHEAARQLGGQLHVITAWNPASVQVDVSINESKNRELVAALNNLQLVHYEALGECRQEMKSAGAIDREESRAVESTTRATAIALGKQFGQYAIFEITPDELRVVGCNADWERTN